MNCITYPNGITKVGFLVNNIFQGPGHIIENGDKKIGTFVDGNLKGPGEIITKNYDSLCCNCSKCSRDLTSTADNNNFDETNNINSTEVRRVGIFENNELEGPGEFIRNNLKIVGTANDNTAVDSISYCINNKAWQNANGTTNWFCSWPIGKFAGQVKIIPDPRPSGHVDVQRCRSGNPRDTLWLVLQIRQRVRARIANFWN